MCIGSDCILKDRGREGREGGEEGEAGDTKKGFNVTLWGGPGGPKLFNQIREVLCDVI